MTNFLNVILRHGLSVKSVVDPKGQGRPPPPTAKKSYFHAFFSKIWQNRILAPLLREILYSPLTVNHKFIPDTEGDTWT